MKKSWRQWCSDRRKKNNQSYPQFLTAKPYSLDAFGMTVENRRHFFLVR
jgi:hypothetical protein